MIDLKSVFLEVLFLEKSILVSKKFLSFLVSLDEKLYKIKNLLRIQFLQWICAKFDKFPPVTS